MSEEVKDMTVDEYLKTINLNEFINLFGTIECAETGNRIPFELWPKQMELCHFLDANKFVVMPKSRQKGFSEISAERVIYTMLRKPNAKGVIISVNEDKARDYKNDRFLPKYKHLMENSLFPVPKIVKETEKEIRLENGSKLLILPASKVGAAGLTGDFIVFDEAGGIDEARGATAAHSHFRQILMNSLPVMNRRPNSWMMIIGTSVPGSFYNELVRDSWNAKTKGDTEFPYKAFFIGCLDEPGRDDEWYRLEKLKYKVNGNEDEMYSQEPRNISEFFYIKDGLVMKEFKHNRHVQYFDLNGNWEYYIGYDHGTDHPAGSVHLAYDPYSDHIYIHNECWFGPEGHYTPVSSIALEIRRTASLIKKPVKAWIADNDIFKDRGIDSVAKVFKDYGIPQWKKAKKHDEKGSLALLREIFISDKITIHPDCVALIEELMMWRYKVKGTNSTPEDAHNDLIDALKYLIAYLKKKKKATPPPPPMPYNRSNQISGNASRFGSRPTEFTNHETVTRNYQSQ